MDLPGAAVAEAAVEVGARIVEVEAAGELEEIITQNSIQHNENQNCRHFLFY